MTPQGIASAAGQQNAAAPTTDTVSVTGILTSIHSRISNIESSIVTLADSAETKYAKYLIPVATGVAGLILGHLI